ncbi:NDUFA12-domain-containing protein [Flagelloscypha sp. PMI_526]|nr:NDUFA12-domain-containing protein [Flagelloscypha sp. PMI_526]
MVSLARTLRNAYRSGFKQWWRFTYYIGDAKFGKLVGVDQHGNKYFENMNPRDEIPGRHRWVDYVHHDNNATQVPPEWHSWLHHTRLLPPTEDPVVKDATQSWAAVHRENLTGTRGAYRPYNTAAPKLYSWEPKIQPRA